MSVFDDFRASNCGFVDLSEIKNTNHQIAIAVTVREYLTAAREGRRPKTAKKIAEQLGYSQSRYSEIKQLYLRDR